MIKFYIQPALRTSNLAFSPLQGQYQFILSPACPTYNDVQSRFQLSFTENSYSICVPSCNVPVVETPIAVATCTNFDGSFTLELSQTRPGGGLSCGSGLVSCTIDIVTTPHLPADCVLDTLIINPGQGEIDACEVPNG